jgi:hypothetical protein
MGLCLFCFMFYIWDILLLEVRKNRLVLFVLGSLFCKRGFLESENRF